MTTLSYRSSAAARLLEREAAKPRIPGPLVDMHSPAQMGRKLQKAYLSGRSFLRGFYYAKKARGSWVSAERAITGMRWNWYLVHGKTIPRSKRDEEHTTKVSQGLLKEMKGMEGKAHGHSATDAWESLPQCQPYAVFTPAGNAPVFDEWDCDGAAGPAAAGRPIASARPLGTETGNPCAVWPEPIAAASGMEAAGIGSGSGEIAIAKGSGPAGTRAARAGHGTTTSFSFQAGTCAAAGTALQAPGTQSLDSEWEDSPATLPGQQGPAPPAATAGTSSGALNQGNPDRTAQNQQPSAGAALAVIAAPPATAADSGAGFVFTVQAEAQPLAAAVPAQAGVQVQTATAAPQPRRNMVGYISSAERKAFQLKTAQAAAEPE